MDNTPCDEEGKGGREGGKEGEREGWREGGGLKLWFGLCFVPDTVNLKVGAILVCGILQSILLQKILYGNL